MENRPLRKYYIGCSGWHYDHWRVLYYPKGLPKSKWLQFYAKEFTAVELNNSFYHFAVKVSRLITHIKRLRNLDAALENFLSRADLLKGKLGPLLYQLPPNMKRNDEMLENFLSSLPPEYQHVFEFRHASWLDDSVFRILQQYKAGLCVFDMPGFTCPLVATTDFAYVRFHGSHGLYSSCYSNEELSQWAQNLVQLDEKVKTVHIYFNNDAEAFAVRNALSLPGFIDIA
jgi:uncharacterized protein YecE (DUF72 family)